MRIGQLKGMMGMRTTNRGDRDCALSIYSFYRVQHKIKNFLNLSQLNSTFSQLLNPRSSNHSNQNQKQTRERTMTKGRDNIIQHTISRNTTADSKPFPPAPCEEASVKHNNPQRHPRNHTKISPFCPIFAN